VDEQIGSLPEEPSREEGLPDLIHPPMIFHPRLAEISKTRFSLHGLARRTPISSHTTTQHNLYHLSSKPDKTVEADRLHSYAAR
jgi:hypothetical protein